MALRSLAPWRRSSAPARRETDPFLTLRREIDSLFEDFFRGWPGERPGSLEFAPPVDVKETENEIVVRAEVPGLDQKDLEVSLTGDQLVIEGEKKEEKEEKHETWHYREASFGSFRRVVPLPCEVDADKVKASYKNGVLTVTLPKSAQAEKRKKIQVSG